METNIKLSEKEQEWLDIVKKKLKTDHIPYCVSWWLRIETGEKTSTINYWLTKLVNKGLLRKETDCYCSKYYLINVK